MLFEPLRAEDLRPQRLFCTVDVLHEYATEKWWQQAFHEWSQGAMCC
jgi:hypothetical protein